MKLSSPPIDSWSFSRLEAYEQCPYRIYLQYVEKIPQPELVPPPGKDEHPLMRGRRVHDAAEDYVKRDIELIPELAGFADELAEAREHYRVNPDLCVVEEDWAITQEWKLTGWHAPDTWGRMKLDLGLLNEERTEMRIVDYKTGKKYPAKHVQQGQLYSIAAFERFPTLEKVDAAFWYVDIEDPEKDKNVLANSYSRIKATILKDGFQERAEALTTATEFPPKSSAYACRFCPYGEGRDGNSYCEYRFSFDQ